MSSDGGDEAGVAAPALALRRGAESFACLDSRHLASAAQPRRHVTAVDDIVMQRLPTATGLHACVLTAHDARTQHPSKVNSCTRLYLAFQLGMRDCSFATDMPP
jgi:hypothetical protein